MLFPKWKRAPISFALVANLHELDLTWTTVIWATPISEVSDELIYLYRYVRRDNSIEVVGIRFVRVIRFGVVKHGFVEE